MSLSHRRRLRQFQIFLLVMAVWTVFGILFAQNEFDQMQFARKLKFSDWCYSNLVDMEEKQPMDVEEKQPMDVVRTQPQQEQLRRRPWLNIDSEPILRTGEALAREAGKASPNIPIEFLYGVGKGQTLDNNVFMPDREQVNCSVTLPRLEQLHLSNDLWQRFIHLFDGNKTNTLWLYSAHLDLRDPTDHLARVFLASEKWENPTKISSIFCHFWYLRKDSSGMNLEWMRTTEARRFHYLFLEPSMDFRHSATWFAGSLVCPLPPPDESQVLPHLISLSNGACGGSGVRNALKLSPRTDGTPQALAGEERQSNVGKSKLALCVSALIYTNRDVSLKFVEWLETLREQDFSKVVIYVYALHPNVARVLERYQDEGFVDLLPFSLSGGQPATPQLMDLYFERSRMFSLYQHYELISRHDCFYRYMGGYENIAIMDTDELFVPTKHISITVMLEELESLYPGFHSVNFESFLYLPLQSISKEQPKLFCHSVGPLPTSEAFHMSSSVYRSKPVAEARTIRKNKSILRSEEVVMFSSHESKECVKGKACRQVVLGHDVCVVHHYRDACKKTYFDCHNLGANLERDESVLKYLDAVAPRVIKVLDDLDLQRSQPVL